MTEISQLPPSERSKRYRTLAGDVRREGVRSTGDVREAYFLMAERWDKLAAAAEALVAEQAVKAEDSTMTNALPVAALKEPNPTNDESKS